MTETEPSLSKDFSIGESLQYGWESVKDHTAILIGATAILILASLSLGAISDIIPADAIVLGILVAVAVYLIQSVLTLGYTYLGLNIYHGERASYQDLIEPIGKVWSYVGASILYGIIVTVGLLLFIVPGIYWGVKFAFYTYPILEEDAGPIEALKRSSDITDDAKWQLLGFWIVVGILNFIGLLALGIGILVTGPVTLLATISVYYILKEATDGTTPPAKRDDTTPAVTNNENENGDTEE